MILIEIISHLKAAWAFYEKHKSEVEWDITVLNPPWVFGVREHMASLVCDEFKNPYHSRHCTRSLPSTQSTRRLRCGMMPW